MSLYRKHRPETLEALVGNDAQIEALQGIFAEPMENWPRAFLISGPSGCGKTTIARILARQHIKAPEMNIREVNTADNRGIDTAREIIDTMRYIPPGGGPLVYVIDECHMTTKEWQNAMLKPLEDGPRWVFFFLCTTIPAKLDKAIHTRCTQITVEPQNEKSLFRLARRVAKAEKFEISDRVLEALSVAAAGSPRAALVALEKVSTMRTEESQMLAVEGSVEEETETRELCQALLGSDWKAVSKALAGLRQQDAEKTRRAVLGYMTSVVLNSGKPKAALVLRAFQGNTYDVGFPGVVYMAYASMHQ